jgi:GTP cyclohydrolase II
MFFEDLSLVTVDRCVFELRQGRPVVVRGDAGAWLVSGLEPNGDRGRQVLAALAADRVELLLNGYRAAALRLRAGPAALPVTADIGTRLLERLGFGRPSAADLDLVRPRLRPLDGDDAAEAAFVLTRLAETVPALLALRSGPTTAAAFAGLRDRGTVLATSVAHVAEFRRANASDVRRLAEAPVPLPTEGDVRFVAYRSRDSLTDHVAVVIGRPEADQAPLVRLHSACLTGDIFRSLRCDCGEQLDTAITEMSEAGGGVICYLAQEGRGIGIANKLRAYALQNAGLDTLEANEALGFAADEREFAIAARMLQDLGLTRVRLMTNNPDKIARLRSCNIDVVDRVGLQATLNPHNERYIRARVAKTGYLHAVNG